MRIALACKALLGVSCFFFVVPDSAAQVAVAARSGTQNDPPPPIERLIERAQAQEDNPPRIDLVGDLLKDLPYHAPEHGKDQEAMNETFGWVRWIVLGIIGALASWQISQAIWRKPALIAEPPKARVEELGLGVDGKGGVWRREARTWESQS